MLTLGMQDWNEGVVLSYLSLLDVVRICDIHIFIFQGDCFVITRENRDGNQTLS